MFRSKLIPAIGITGLVSATMAVVVTLVATGQFRGDGADQGDQDRLCPVASDWRHAAEAFEIGRNSFEERRVRVLDRSSDTDLRELRSRWTAAANLVFPSKGGSASESALLSAIENWNSAADSWLASVSPRDVAPSAIVTKLNAAYRRVNPYLVEVCGLTPIALYKG